MKANIDVTARQGVLHCHRCGSQVSYDLRGLPPGVAQRAQCQCGEAVRVKRGALRGSLGPQETKGAAGAFLDR